MYKVLCLHTVKQEIISAGGLNSLFYLSFQPECTFYLKNVQFTLTGYVNS